MGAKLGRKTGKRRQEQLDFELAGGIGSKCEEARKSEFIDILYRIL